MKNVIEIKTFDKFSVTISGKLRTAIEMLEFEEKLETQQETMGRFDVFNEQIREYLWEKGYLFNIYPRYYKGIDDVIFEIKFYIIENSEKVERLPLYSNQILGEVISKVYAHFEWKGYDKPVFRADECYEEDIKNLIILQ